MHISLHISRRHDIETQLSFQGQLCIFSTKMFFSSFRIFSSWVCILLHDSLMSQKHQKTVLFIVTLELSFVNASAFELMTSSYFLTRRKFSCDSLTLLRRLEFRKLACFISVFLIKKITHGIMACCICSFYFKTVAKLIHKRYAPISKSFFLYSQNIFGNRMFQELPDPIFTCVSFLFPFQMAF